ncbi:MAG TPA: anthranilate synthase component I [Nitriliruptorales bacterium]
MTVSPSRERFLELSQQHAVVPVWREVLADLETPLSVYAKISGARPTFLLESAEHGERWGRYSFVGTDPFLTLRGDRGRTTLEGDVPDGIDASRPPLEVLQQVVEALRGPTFEELPPLHGGAVGYVAYDAVREVEDIPDTGTDDLRLPDVLMVFPRHIVALDHMRQVLTAFTNVVIGDDPGAQYEAAVAATDALIDRMDRAVPTRPVAPPVLGDVGDVPGNMTSTDYEAMVDRVKEYIRAGDTFQTVVSQRYALDTTADPFDVYRVLRVINPSPYLYLFDLEDFHIVGSSPEALVQVHGDHVETWPIAGTRPRGQTPERDRELERELLSSAKERAEHVMLVDLGRNDLGRVCATGTVKVDDMMMVERYSNVMHLVSSVTGKLREGLGPLDVLRAVFPAGTVSGAPKVRAMQIIDELEPTRRGLYAGAVGYVDFSGNLDTCIAIRTLVIKDGVAYGQAGAGIVADSDPAAEDQECRSKARAMLSAVRAAESV